MLVWRRLWRGLASGDLPMSLTVVAEGQPWRGFKSINIRRSMDEIFHTLSASTTDRYQEGVARWNVRGGTDIQAYWNNDLLFSGIVKKYRPSITGTSHDIQIEAESYAADLAECGHEGPYYFKNMSREAVVAAVLDPYGFGYDIAGEMKSIGADGFRVAVDDSAANILFKLAEKDRLTVFTGNDGRIKFSDGSDAPTMSPLTTCDYTAFDAEHDISRAYSRLRVKSQKNVKFQRAVEGPTGSGANKQTQKYKTFSGVQRHEEIIDNPGQPRYRPLIILHNGEIADVDDFARYAKQRFTGDSVSASLTVKSVYDKNGDLWGINQLLPVFEPAADLNETLIISEYDLSITETTGLDLRLTLREPGTYNRSAANTNARRRTLRRSDSVFSQIFRGIFNV